MEALLRQDMPFPGILDLHENNLWTVTFEASSQLERNSDAAAADMLSFFRESNKKPKMILLWMFERRLLDFVMPVMFGMLVPVLTGVTIGV